MVLELEQYVNNPLSLYISAALVVLTALYYFYKTRSLPPGPTGLPYIGFWPFWRKDCHVHLHELRKKYGDVFSFTITGRLYINLGSFKALREAHVTKSDCFAEKAKGFTMLDVGFKESLVALDGEEWKTNRKFFTQQFRERGMSTLKDEMCSGKIYDAIKDTVKDFRNSKGEPVEIIEMLMDKCTHVLHSTLFGERGISAKEIRDINEAYCNSIADITGTNILMCGTFARYFLLPLMPSFRRGMKNFDNLRATLLKIVNRHKATYDETNIRNIIDAYFKEKNDRLSKNDPTAKHFTDFSLASSLVQIIGDGVLAVAALVSTFFQVLLDHPEEQEKIYKELIEVIGTDRDPVLEDKKNLPYTNAFISEVLRTSDAFPFFPKMECTKETYIRGYRIPKGSITVMNIWSIHYDPDEYEDPQRFNPLRYLPAEGKRKPEQPVLFGLGKRSCLGEGYTMSQVFLFLVTIMKHFRLTKPKDMKENTLLFLVGRVHLCAQPRQ